MLFLIPPSLSLLLGLSNIYREKVREKVFQFQVSVLRCSMVPQTESFENKLEQDRESMSWR